MLPIERRREILNTVMIQGSVKADDLAKKYGVGVPTIRRDLKYLAREHGVELMYGGAFIREKQITKNVEEINLIQKRTSHIEEKRMIAQKAASLIENDETIILNSGSTVEMILDYLDQDITLNLLTLSINVAYRASIMPNVTVYMPGGKLRNITGAIVGDYGMAFLRQFNVDKAFIGVSAVAINKGVTHTSLEEVKSNQILTEIASRLFLVTDSSKFDKVSMIHMLDLNIFEGFITDNNLPNIYKEYASNNNIKIY